jgi:radical SAM protein with 4Fe4S-binding SPASM domain
MADSILQKSLPAHNGRLMHFEFIDIISELTKKHGQKFIDYRKEWNLAANCEFVPARPLYVALETNSNCNFKCKMCPHSSATWRGGSLNKKNIDLSLVKKLSDQIKELNIPSLNIGAFTECTINKNIKDILKIFSEFEIMDKFLFTNGSMLNQDLCNFLVEFGWERVYISLDAANADTYKNIRGYDLNKVEQNILRLMEIKRKKQSVFPIVRVSFVIQPENENEVDKFYNKWENKIDVIDFQKFIDFEKKNQPIENFTFKKCQGPFVNLSITCEGEILPCCSEYGKDLSLGNLENISLMEAWNCNKMQNLRKSFLEKANLPYICQVCLRDI